MRFKQFLKEKFHDMYVSIYTKKTVEIFKNPSRKEYREVIASDSVRALLGPKDLYIWNTWAECHNNVKDKSPKFKNMIAVVIFGEYGKDVDVQLTDGNSGTKWDHNPEVYDFIMNHSLLNSMFRSIEVSYYDEAIGGAWHD